MLWLWIMISRKLKFRKSFQEEDAVEKRVKAKSPSHALVTRSFYVTNYLWRSGWVDTGHTRHTWRPSVVRSSVWSVSDQWEARILGLWPIRRHLAPMSGESLTRDLWRWQQSWWPPGCDCDCGGGGIVTVRRGTPEDNKWQVTRVLTCDTRTVMFFSSSNPSID